MSVYPTKLDRTADGLRIEWSDGEQHEISLTQLRKACPCATCREKRNAPPAPSSQLNVITKEEAQPLKLASARPVGNYAYNFTFSDGHDTGIYTFAFLRELVAVE